MTRTGQGHMWWWMAGAVLLGAAAVAVQRALDFDIDFDPWDDAYLY
jgi:hypothetical protein